MSARLLNNVRNALSKEFSKQELLEIVSTIYPLHRIQGSSDLERAVDIVAEYLKKLGIEYRIWEYSYSKSYGLMRPVAGWDPVFGEAKLVKPREELLSSFLQSKTAIVAHSPSGDVEAEVVYVASVEHLDRVDVSEKIVLTSSSPRSIYFKAVKKGAKAFLFFRRNAPSDAVPYIGLFLKPNEIGEATAPAMSIPRRCAHRILSYLEKGSKVVARVRVEARFRGNARIRVLEAWIGKGSEEIHGVAHICHPGGTVNDNVSGCATLLEIALALKRCIDRGALDEPKEGKMVFVWLPEYSGTVPYLNDVISGGRKVVFSIDLDMVGEKQVVTGSTLILIRSPSMLRSPAEGILYSALLNELRGAKTFGDVSPLLEYRFDISPYLRGSDHDVYLKFGIPAVMINQWPDRFYHTDMDTVDKLDPEVCKRVGVAVGSTMYTLASLGTNRAFKEFKPVIEGYDSVVKGLKALSGITSELSLSGLPKTKYVCRAMGLPGRRYFEEVLSEDELKKVDRIVEEGGLYANLLFGFIPIALSLKPMTVEELAKLIVEEYGSVDLDKLQEVISILEKARVIERVE